MHDLSLSSSGLGSGHPAWSSCLPLRRGTWDVTLPGRCDGERSQPSGLALLPLGLAEPRIERPGSSSRRRRPVAGAWGSGPGAAGPGGVSVRAWGLGRGRRRERRRRGRGRGRGLGGRGPAGASGSGAGRGPGRARRAGSGGVAGGARGGGSRPGAWARTVLPAACCDRRRISRRRDRPAVRSAPTPGAGALTGSLIAAEASRHAPSAHSHFTSGDGASPHSAGVWQRGALRAIADDTGEENGSPRTGPLPCVLLPEAHDTPPAMASNATQYRPVMPQI